MAKSKVEMEMEARERFTTKYRKFVRGMSNHQVVVVPDENL